MKKLISKIIINGKIKTLSGLLIGGTNTSMDTGGIKNFVVRNPINYKPYIPGSSLKGALRSCLDLADNTIWDNKIKEKNKVRYETGQDPEKPAVKLFGNAPTTKHKDKHGEVYDQHPSRVIVRDGDLLSEEDLFKNTDLPYTETKTEVVIDRLTAKANPRTFERVPAGAEFELNFVLNIFDDISKTDQLMNLKRAMKLLEDDYLGGNGSRGYGQIEIVIENVLERTVEFYKGETIENDIKSYFDAL
ncbi:MAG: type III-A CRISPR-associated RAMP protein Csm3 [Bacteroidetes bacterium]|nr:type III-A CRISPR-associated RAMP protein Csm3 [Bacteroidota bacterium]MBT6686027.1 type III-A CRISPR-associated RAMP protein Csm3 [Bacteroidota bacterium]MBT7144536.1 type III-A CRISPR-associated RAMP protein Csm3 [Bacteroidota bacterium]MBT7492701.1 type III-A CRISPR-associated RAMP protein Csm3 [Bacteroidota bacterium]